MDSKYLNTKMRSGLLKSLLKLENPNFQRLKNLKLYEKIIFKKLYFSIMNILNDISNIMNFKTVINILIKNNTLYQQYYTIIIKNIEELEKYDYNLHNYVNGIFSENKEEEISNFTSKINILSSIFDNVFIHMMCNENYYNLRDSFNKITNNFKEIKDNYKNFKFGFDSEIIKIQNPTIYEKKYIEYIMLYLKDFKLVEIFSDFKNQFGNELEDICKKEYVNYKKFFDTKLTNNFKKYNLDKDKKLVQASELQIEFLSGSGCNIYSDDFKNKFVKYLESSQTYKYNVWNHFGPFKKNFSIPKKTISKAEFIKENYPSFFMVLPLYYMKKDGEFLKISFNSKDYIPITIEDIINLNIHKSYPPKERYYSVRYGGENCGMVYGHKINGNGFGKFATRLFFYKCYRSIQFNYSLIPENIFWSRKNNFYATNKFIEIFAVSIKKSKVLNIPLELIELILKFISVKDMCKHHEYKKREIFNF